MNLGKKILILNLKRCYFLEKLTPGYFENFIFLPKQGTYGMIMSIF